MAKRSLIIMQGIPGSGKSTMVDMLLDDAAKKKLTRSCRSTDRQWYDEDGRYNYVPALAGLMHRRNQQGVIEDMQKCVDVIIVDNTNITRKDAKPYLVMADVYSYDVTVYRIEVPVEVAIARQEIRPADRRVPEDVIRRMHSTMETLLV